MYAVELKLLIGSGIFLAEHRRKVTEQEDGTSKFSKVAFNCAISSSFYYPSDILCVLLSFVGAVL